MKTKTTFGILVALSVIHCMNDSLQSVISAVYPLLKQELNLSFRQIGIITLTYQISASVLQPLAGMFYDRRPSVFSLPAGITLTLAGIVSLAFADTLPGIICSVLLTGAGSSVLHPEASRLTSLASGGKRGLAQSLFQVGGNFGTSIGPLFVALVVSPYCRQNIVFLSVLALVAAAVMIPVCKWYKRHLHLVRQSKVAHRAPLSRRKTVFAISILLALIFSKYIYMASLTSYYTFYLIEKFNVTMQQSQVFLCLFLISTAAGTLLGGPLGDRIGRKHVIWISILGAAPFALLMPYSNLPATVILSFFTGLTLSSAFPAILLYAQELLPLRLGLVSGLFFGFAFGVAGISSAVLGSLADLHGIASVYSVCSFMPLMGFIAFFLPSLHR
jgi:FSR family fosmidomycin resistance protein-like MFS transporter